VADRRAADEPLAALYDTALLDLDGVVYRGADAVPHAVGALKSAADGGMRLAYVTNNASRTPETVAEHLRELGLPAAAEYVVTAAQAVARLIAEQVPSGARVLVLGLTFKENCPDVRNTKVADIVKELASFGCKVDVYDPWADPAEAHHEYGITPIGKPKPGSYDGIVVAVAHKEFLELGVKGIRAFANPNAVIFDIKCALPKEASDGRL